VKKDTRLVILVSYTPVFYLHMSQKVGEGKWGTTIADLREIKYLAIVGPVNGRAHAL